MGDPQERLVEKKALAKKGVVLSAAKKRKITFKDLIEKYTAFQKSNRFYEASKNYFIQALSDYFGDSRLFRITALDIEDFKKQKKETPLEFTTKIS